MSFVVSGIGNKGHRLFAANHPANKRDRTRFVRRLKQAHVFSSMDTAKNVRDDMLKTFKNVTVSRA